MISNDEHEKNQKVESNHVDSIGDFWIYARTFYFLNQQEKQPSTIECRKWNKIYNREIYRN